MNSLWRVCWESRLGNIIRTKWKPYDRAATHFKDKQKTVRNVWMEEKNN